MSDEPGRLAPPPQARRNAGRTAEEWISLVRVLVLIALLPALWFGIISVAHPALNAIIMLFGAYVVLMAVGPRRFPVLRKPDLVIVLDLLVITLVVLISGSLKSPFLYLYYLTILEAAARLNLRQALAASLAMAGIIVIFWLQSGHMGVLDTLGFRLGGFIASGFFLALFLGMLAQEYRSVLERTWWADLLDQRLQQATAQLEEQMEELQFYNMLASRLSGELRVEGVLDILLKVFLEVTGLPKGMTYALKATGELRLVGTRGFTAEEADHGLDRLSLPVLPDNAGSGEVFFHPGPLDNGQAGATIVCVPLVRAGHTRAWLCGLNGASPMVTESVRRRLSGMASQGVSALEAARVHEHAMEMAVTDWLTGLANRRGFVDRLTSELSRSRRTGRPVSIVLLDLNRFKAINDTHGHTIGDAALIQVAKVLTRSVRTYDLPARLGGDEFIMLFPETTDAQAEIVLNRLRAEEISVPDGKGGTLRLDFSWGLAVWPQDGLGAEQLLETADRRLYSMKQRLHDEALTGSD